MRTPFNRRTYPWGSEDQTLLDWYTALGKARKELPALRRGDLRWGQTQGRLLTFFRQGEGDQVLAAVNAGRKAAAVEVPWPAVDWMTGKTIAPRPAAAAPPHRLAAHPPSELNRIKRRRLTPSPFYCQESPCTIITTNWERYS